MVDDEPHILHYVRATLEAWGHKVDVAADGQAALAQVGEAAYDLIISDLRMPRTGGQEFYEELGRRFPSMADRVAFSTGDTIRGDTLQFLEKPAPAVAAQTIQSERTARAASGILQLPPVTGRTGPRSLRMPRIIHVASGREWRGGQRQVLLLARALNHERDLEPDGHDFPPTASSNAGCGATDYPVESVPWSAGLDPRVILPLFASRVVVSPPFSTPMTAMLSLLPHSVPDGPVQPLVATRRVDFPLRRPWPWRQANRVIAISHAVRDVLIASGVPPDESP